MFPKVKSILLCSLPLILFCSNQENPVNENLETFHFPLAVGNQWEYLFEERFFDCTTPDSAIVETFLVPINLNIKYNITHTEALQDSIITFYMAENKTNLNDSLKLQDGQIIVTLCFERDVYYADSEDGLYQVGQVSRNTCNDTESKMTNIPSSLMNFRTTKSELFLLKVPPSLEGSLQEPQRKIFQYPLEVGQEWISVGTPFKILKKVVGIETVNVNAGEFNCFKIQYFYDMDDDGVWDPDIEFFEYVAEQGLILKHFFLENVGISHGVNPPDEPQFFCNYEMKQELISYHLE